MRDLLQALDTRVLLWANGHHSPWGDALMWWASQTFTWVPFYAALLALLGPKLPFYVMGIVSFTAFFHVMYEGLTRHLSLGPVLLYAVGSLLSDLLLAGVGLWLARLA